MPMLGRPILPDDELPGKPGVVVLTYRFWEKSFGLDPDALDAARAEGTQVLPGLPFHGNGSMD